MHLGAIPFPMSRRGCELLAASPVERWRRLREHSNASLIHEPSQAAFHTSDRLCLSPPVWAVLDEPERMVCLNGFHCNSWCPFVP